MRFIDIIRRIYTRRHKWELPGNYRDFIGVMVFYSFVVELRELSLPPSEVSKFIYICSH